MALLKHWLLGETSGTTVVAEVGSNGTFNGDTDIEGVGAGNGPGGSNLGIVLRKADSEYIDLGANSLNGKTAFTVCFWMKTSDSASATYTNLFGFEQTSQPTLVLQAPAVATTQITALTRNSYGQMAVTYTSTARWWATGVWRHYAVIAKSGTRGITIYMDGVQMQASGTVNFSMTNTTQKWGVGAVYGVAGDSFYGFCDGQFADFRIYDSDESANLATIMADLPASNPTISSVTLSGTSQIGNTLTATVVTDQDPVDSTAYRWQTASDGSGTGAADISGETASTLTLTYADFGSLLDTAAYVRCGAIATKNSLASDEAFSAWQPVTVAAGTGGSGSPLNLPCIL